MQDTSFGKVEVSLSYEEMIELVSTLTIGEPIKLREDLISGCQYRVDMEGSYVCCHTIASLNGALCKIESIDKDKSIKVNSYWVSFNMVDIDWLFKQKKANIGVSDDPSNCLEDKDWFYRQAEELSQISKRELEDSIDKLNEALNKYRAINKEVNISLVNGYGMCCINTIKIKEDTPRTIRFIVD